MKLWRLTKKEDHGAVYEEMYMQKIILAQTEILARKIANDNLYGDSKWWEDRQQTICEEINLESVHAGFLGGIFYHCW